MTGTLEQLQRGKCLCTVCGEINPPGWLSLDGSTECWNGCEYDNGNRAEVIAWKDVVEGLPISQKQHDWLAEHHPEILAEAERQEAAGFLARELFNMGVEMMKSALPAE